MEKEYVTWDIVNRFADIVSRAALAKLKHISGVYGLPRGGLVPAVMISHRLDIPLLMSPMDNCIIVDDICDSGESLTHYVNNSSGTEPHHYFIATIFGRTDSQVQPDFYSREKTDRWIVFPWEEF